MDFEEAEQEVVEDNSEDVAAPEVVESPEAVETETTPPVDLPLPPRSGNAENIRNLREQARQGKEAQVELAETKRKIAVLESGVDFASPRGRLLMKALEKAPDFLSLDSIPTAAELASTARIYGVGFRPGFEEDEG